MFDHCCELFDALFDALRLNKKANPLLQHYPFEEIIHYPFEERKNELAKSDWG